MQVLIDGEPYIKQTKPTEHLHIGVGITTHNRNELVASTVAKILAVTPNARVVVVDDASTKPVQIDGVEVYRFDQNVGIARAKNKCIELLEGCQNIFLFDDDTYPIKDGWYVPYVNSPEHHLMYLFDKWASGKPVGDDAVVYSDDQHTAHSHARGCMLYVDSVAVATVGGMDVRFGKAMEEHADWSNRIHNAGLTTFKYMDVINSDQLIYSMDQHQEIATSIARADRVQGIQRNGKLIADRQHSAEFAPYGKDVVIACYFANVVDPQRGTAWSPDLKAIDKLKRSVEAHGIEFVLIHNCFDLPNKVTITSSPYFERWLKEWQYLRDRRDINNVFVVDATDVDMLNNPFDHIKPGVLYVGDEPAETLNNHWLLTKHREPSVNNYLRKNLALPMLNCGVVGGERRLVMDVCREIYMYHFNNPQDQTEMGIFNKLMHQKYGNMLEYGRHVTTLFKKYEAKSNAWFRHK